MRRSAAQVTSCGDCATTAAKTVAVDKDFVHAISSACCTSSLYKLIK